MSRSVGRAIGLDVHRDFCEVAICEAGRVRSAGRIKTSPEVLELFAQSLGREDRVALEVTGGAWEIARILEGHVRRVVVVSPDDTGIRQARAKTDRLDARTLARLLWAGELDAVWMPDEALPGDAPPARAPRAVGALALAREERDPRGADAPPAGPAAGVGPVRGQGTQVAVRARAAGRGGRDAAERAAPHRVPRRRDRRGRAADRARGAGLAGRAPADDRARRERDLRRDVPGRGRRHPPLPHVGGARRLPRPGSARAPVRQRARQGRPDLQARLKLGALGAGRGGLVGRPTARSAARLLPAHPRPPRARQGDRRGRAQARGAVLVSAHAAARTTPTSSPR